MFDEDWNQRDEMMHSGMRSEAVAKHPFPREMLWHDTLRLPLPPGSPPRRFKLTGEILPDVWRTYDGTPVVSAAFLAALHLPPEAAQVVSIELESNDPRAHAKGYALLRVLVGAACMDHGRSEFEEKDAIHLPTGRSVRHLSVRRFVLDPATVPPADLFWSEESPRTLVATEALAGRVQAGGLRGAAFGDPWSLDEWGNPQALRAPDGSRVPYREEPFGVLPVRDPAHRPPFVPDPGLPEALRPIEAAVRHRLPGHYVRFLLKPPAGLHRLYASKCHLPMDPARVAEINRGVRAVEDNHFLRGGGAWPDDWLAIGDDGTGNYYALDLGEPSPPVLFWDHDAAAALIEASSLEAYVTECIEGATEDDIREDEDF